jgi:hypothetical protein
VHTARASKTESVKSGGWVVPTLEMYESDVGRHDRKMNWTSTLDSMYVDFLSLDTESYVYRMFEWYLPVRLGRRGTNSQLTVSPYVSSSLWTNEMCHMGRSQK